ncbi:MAG TPA: bifunctional UDP-sugar hydrolase/5'-nucleotidase [Kofleriaceae bacterium]|jgi:5'-nucleotidase|nr:bifunctional UDP-sugar hydrolase/5'-nucleotidase [Kofleriaceae bacterium]
MRPLLLAACTLIACSHAPVAPVAPSGPALGDGSWRPVGRDPAPPPVGRAVTISVVGTNDLHGALERLPLFAGFVANLRAARAADGGGVVLVDGGDMFQGTLESNLTEGADIVRAYNYIGYAGVAIGNHEFDYGPEGPAVIATHPTDDPRGALKARAREAKFPFLAANLVDSATGSRILWPNMPGATLVDIAGVKVGIIGVSTESTPTTTMPANFVGLRISPPAQAIVEQATALRAQGARAIIATMHIGTNCKQFDQPDDSSSCDRNQELFNLLKDLPHGTVDVIVGGHTHAGVAHRIDGVAVIESYASGRAFGRVDLRIGADGKITDVQIDKPHLMCALDKNFNPVPVADCHPGDYEGKPVTPDPEVQKIVDTALARAGERRQEKLGVVLADIVRRAHAAESPEGNLFTDLMLEARPDAQVAMTNGGGLRADLPAGSLTYGALFEALPFDNRFAIVELTGKDLRSLVSTNLAHSGGILSWGGLSARARCKAGKLDVQVLVRGKPVDDNASYKMATSDFLASGGDGVIARLKLPETKIQVTDTIIREAVADVLRGWKATPRAAIDPSRLYMAARPRLDYEGKRPVECGGHPAEHAGDAKEPTP